MVMVKTWPQYFPPGPTGWSKPGRGQNLAVAQKLAPSGSNITTMVKTWPCLVLSTTASPDGPNLARVLFNNKTHIVLGRYKRWCLIKTLHPYNRVTAISSRRTKPGLGTFRHGTPRWTKPNPSTFHHSRWSKPRDGSPGWSIGRMISVACFARLESRIGRWKGWIGKKI